MLLFPDTVSGMSNNYMHNYNLLHYILSKDFEVSILRLQHDFHYVHILYNAYNSQEDYSDIFLWAVMFRFVSIMEYITPLFLRYIKFKERGCPHG